MDTHMHRAFMGYTEDTIGPGLLYEVINLYVHSMEMQYGFSILIFCRVAHLFLWSVRGNVKIPKLVSQFEFPNTNYIMK